MDDLILFSYVKKIDIPVCINLFEIDYLSVATVWVKLNRYSFSFPCIYHNYKIYCSFDFWENTSSMLILSSQLPNMNLNLKCDDFNCLQLFIITSSVINYFASAFSPLNYYSLSFHIIKETSLLGYKTC